MANNTRVASRVALLLYKKQQQQCFKKTYIWVKSGGYCSDGWTKDKSV